MSQPKVSIVIPVYNAEQYIEKCVRSLFGQTLDSLQYIFVDDCSPDDSIEVVERVLKEFPDRQLQVQFLRNEKNIGVGQTRQRGIDESEGEYIIHCDPDDWVDVDMYEKLYSKAKESDADIVMCDFVKEYGNHSENIGQPLPDSKRMIFHYITIGLIHSSLCNKLIKSNIAKKFRVRPGINLWEDTSVTPCALMISNIVEKVDGALYHYNLTNTSSVTHDNRFNNSLSAIEAVKSLTKYLKESDNLEVININDLYRLQFEAKRGLLSRPTKENLDLWNVTFPEVNHHYLEIGLVTKTKILAYLAKHHYLRILKMYDKIYGL